ncbi:Rieske (2Fe-2S) protein [Haloferax namakaokahaiae]|uniref:Rieske (2Fe-2S) protein n=1 Tax=Haloferax namakaokahaiae TaxID=1748331 RepID=A0ABD5ZDH2_9EURY
MTERTRIVAVEDVPENGSYLFTAEDSYANEREILLVQCEEDPGVRAWINTCTHENQKFDRGDGAAVRDGELICPKHGSMFDTCSGACDNGEAAGTTLPGVGVTVDAGDVFLSDDAYTYLHDGGIDADDDGDGGPSSTSHIGF